MSAHLWQIPAIVALLIGVSYGVYVAYERSRKEREREEAIADEQRTRDHAAGIVDEHGRQLCAVCQRDVAEQPYLMLTHKDADWRGYRRSQGCGPLYAIKNRPGIPLLCPPHHRLMYRKWAEILAHVASRRSAFNAKIEQELAEWDAGKLLAWARMEAMESQARLAELLADHVPHKQLTVGAPPEVTPLPMPTSVSTVTLEPGEDPDAEEQRS